MKFAVLFVLIALAFTPAAYAGSLEDTLNHQYKDQTYVLRHSMTASTQQYDEQGNSSTESSLGPWTIYGRMRIKKITLQPTQLVIEGRRIGMEFNDHARMLVPMMMDEKMRLEISLSQPLNSPEQAHALLSRIFAFSKEDFLASLPEFWRTYLNDYIEAYEDDGKLIILKPQSPVKEPQKIQETPSPDTYHVGGDITAPKPTYQPDPEYANAARQQKFNGHVVLYIVIDKTGSVRSSRLELPAGLGLDEEAQQTVNTWKFKPATRHGKPVAVEVMADFAFELTN